MSYEYSYSEGTADFQRGIQARLNFSRELINALNNNNSEELMSVINKIMKWGGMKPYRSMAADITRSLRILESLESEDGSWHNLVGTRIASTSKIYAMYSPRLWSIYDSRVGKGIQTIISRYDVPRTISEYLDFPCPPGRNRGPIEGFRTVGTKRQAILGFLYGSWLFRAIASRLNEGRILLPEPIHNEDWVVYHIEMVFFMIGK